MANKIDVMRIIEEKKTVTSDDMAEALEMSPQGANSVLWALENKKMIYRIRVGHYYLYALTVMGERIIEKQGPIDPSERLLLLELNDESGMNREGW
jgi:predicted transcriptional regulator of viral defense system